MKLTFKDLDYLFKGANTNNHIFMFHGYGANKNDLYPLAEYLDPSSNWNWYFINAPLKLEMGMMEARAWFPLDEKRFMLSPDQRQSDLQNNYPKELDDLKIIIYEFIKNKLSEFKQNGHNSAQGKIALGGFSQGSMIVSHLAPELVKFPIFNYNLTHLLIYSGALLGYEKLMSAFEKLENSKSQTPIINFLQSHGSEDTLLPEQSAKKLFELLNQYFQGTFISFRGWHEIPLNVLQESKKLLS